MAFRAFFYICNKKCPFSFIPSRGQALFSHEGLAPAETQLEYAWLLEALIGRVSARLTPPQLSTLLDGVQTLLFLASDAENNYDPPSLSHRCVHDNDGDDCPERPRRDLSSDDDLPPCPAADDMKYSLCRLSLDDVSLFLVESGAALNIRLSPARFATCNLHTTTLRRGISAHLDNLTLQQV